MMKKTVLLIGLLSLILATSGCSLLRKKDTSFAGQGTASMVKTEGLVDDSYVLDSLKNDPGPHEGLLSTRSFYFAFNSNIVDPSDYSIIQAHAKYLVENPNKKVIVEGNCDTRGSREYNIALGQRRANAVKSLLKQGGVPAKQIQTISYGSEKPIALGDTEDAYRLDRRDDIRYLN